MVLQLLGGLFDMLLAVVLNFLLFLLFLAVLFVGSRVEARVSARRRARLYDQLRADGFTAETIDEVTPHVEYVAAHGTLFTAGFGLLAAIALGILSTQSTNRTLIAASYGGAAVLFSVYTAISVYRYERARRVWLRLRTYSPSRG